eukprot:2989309-Pyramimonas_sp.AAC.1
MGGSHVVGSALVDSPGGGVWGHDAHETLLANQPAEEAAPAPRGLLQVLASSYSGQRWGQLMGALDHVRRLCDASELRGAKADEGNAERGEYVLVPEEGRSVPVMRPRLGAARRGNHLAGARPSAEASAWNGPEPYARPPRDA